MIRRASASKPAATSRDAVAIRSVRASDFQPRSAPVAMSRLLSAVAVEGNSDGIERPGIRLNAGSSGSARNLVSVIVPRDRAGSVGPCNFKPLRKYVEEGRPTGCYQEQSKRTRYHLRGNYQTKPNNAYGSRIFSEALDGNRSRGTRSSVLFASDEQGSAVQEAKSTLGVNRVLLVRSANLISVKLPNEAK
jgi:hypothetical protein